MSIAAFRTATAAGAIALSTALTTTNASAQDVYDPALVDHITDSCGATFTTYTNYPTSINTYGPACHDAVRTEIHDFFDRNVLPSLKHQKDDDSRTAMHRGAAHAELQGNFLKSGSCNAKLDNIDLEKAGAAGAGDYSASTGQYEGPYYEALNAYTDCLNGILGAKEKFQIPWSAATTNDFNILAGQVMCMNDDGKYPDSTSESKIMCPQMESLKKRHSLAPDSI